MKTGRILLFLSLLISILTGCNQLKPDDYSRYVGTIIQQEIGDYGFYILIDDGPIVVSDDYDFEPSDFEDSTRIACYLSSVNEYDDDNEFQVLAKVRDVVTIMEKPVYNFYHNTSDEEKDSIGSDPVNIVTAWIYNDFLNIEYNYYGSGYRHPFELVFDETKPQTETYEIYLYLHHQANNDPYYYELWNVISFDISSLQQFATDSLTIRLEAQGYDDYYYSSSLDYNFSE